MSELRLLAVGDISLKTKGQERPFDGAMGILKNKSLLFGNLETTLSERGRECEKSVVLSAPPSAAGNLVEAGFDVVNIANNHIMDRGPQGFHDTVDTLRRNKIAFVGAGNLARHETAVILERDGLRLGFLGYSEDGFENKTAGIFVKGITLSAIKDDISELRENCDFVVVSLHWGIENVHYPSIAQIGLARKIIESGANVVLGHHPHVVQGIERYKHGLIAYSLGNFQFDVAPLMKKIRHRTNLSIVLAITLDHTGIKSYETIPVEISESHLPVKAEGQVKERIIRLISEISRPIAENSLTTPQWYEETAPIYIADSLISWKRRIRLYGITHLISFLSWLVKPFVIRCHLSLGKKWLRKTRLIRFAVPKGRRPLVGDLREGL